MILKNRMINIKRLFPLILIVMLFYPDSKAAITNVVLTPANPTMLSTLKAYYLAGIQYDFDVEVSDPAATGWGDITGVQLVIPNGGGGNDIDVSINPVGTGAQAVVVNSPVGDITANANIPAGDTFNNFTVTFSITIHWSLTDSPWVANQPVTANATPVTGSSTDTVNVSYGTCSGIRILDFTHFDDALDNKVNPWHNAFDISNDGGERAAIVYDVPGATNNDKVNNLDNNEITGTVLLIDGADTSVMGTPVPADNVLSNDAADDISYQVPATFMNSNGLALGNHTWSVEAAMATAGGPVTTSNSLTIDVNQVEVLSVVFINGGGVDAAPLYHRDVNTPGTQVQVTAQMESGPVPMQGDTTVRIQDSAGNTMDVLIPNGMNTGVVNVSYPAVPADVPDTDTTGLTYEAVLVTGGLYDDEQNAAARITQPAVRTIYWDSNDPPGDAPAAGPFCTSAFTVTPTATTLTMSWDPTAGSARLVSDEDMDFYTYRVYYRVQGSGNPFSVIDRTTAGYAALANRATNTVTVTGLVPFTQYDYYITGIDVYGQEVDDGSGAAWTVAHNAMYRVAPGTNTEDGNYYSVDSTLQASTEVTISDGVDQYVDNHFTTNPNAADRPLQQNNIRLDITIVTGGTMPDEVNVILAALALGDILDNGTAQIDAAHTVDVDYYRIPSNRTGPNTYTAFVPSSNPLISAAPPTDLQFVIETVRGAVRSYSDHDADTDTNENGVVASTFDGTDWRYEFQITTQPTFTPWPTRVLNNVITKSNPTAYPAYYLSQDAYVTIKVYDVKGRPVATLIDNSFRRGGQNIKDQGWNGTNKANRKLGLGLYYMHFKAVTGGGKVVLNDFRKVVIAK